MRQRPGGVTSTIPAASTLIQQQHTEDRMTFNDLVTATNPAFLQAFGEPAAIGGESLYVIFDEPYRGVSPYTGEVETTEPAASVDDSDLVRLSIAHGTVITIRGTAYTVIGSEPAAGGMTRLKLGVG